ncbi:MAG TPA: cupredoxin family copper-binding protein [Methylomirabilota bacterium]|nr:cupredoxin family copper-binding protein [Methylomirabilota bacterium]
MPTRQRGRLGRAVAVAGLLALSLAVPSVLAADKSVAIRDFAFSPKTLNVRVGDVVTWTNQDTVAHSATARGGRFDTGLIQPGDSASIRFTIGGVYRYICTPHPNMTGTVIARAAAAGGVPPPNTDAAKVASSASGGTAGSPFAAWVVFAGIAYVVAVRLLRRRGETA